MNIDKLQADASAIDWTPLSESNTVDEKVELLNEVVTKLYDKHAPIKKTKLKRPPAPWMSEGIRMAMRRRDRVFCKYRRDRCDSNWIIFKAARNRCNQMVRNAKRRYILNNIDSSSSANLWKFLGTLGIGNVKNLDFPKTIGLDDINNHFTHTKTMNVLIQQQTMDYIRSLPQSIIAPFNFSPVAPEEIKKTILSIKSKAVGCDNLSRHMIISILEQILPVITHIINFSLFSCQFPSQWRKAYVRPLPKISNPSLPNHFRPISILPFLSKVLEASVHRQLSRFIFTNNILTPLQSGFRPGHSTVSALLKVIGDVKAGIEDTKVTVLVLIDFSNAFNTVNHDILLSILFHFMISSDALDWFSSYLRGRQQSVRVDETTSRWCCLDTGVPQGGILSPLLFSLFINLLAKDLLTAYHLYADDLQLYAQSSVDDIKEAIDSINNDLSIIKAWTDRFGLEVNPSKCQAILIGSPRMVSRIDIKSLTSIIFDGSIIPLSPSVKDLGLHIDATLDWRTQVANISQKVTGTLRCLYRLKNFLPVNTKVMLVQTLIFPVIDYGDVCYLDLNADLLNKLDRLLNNCIRFVFNLRKYDHISAYRTELHWLPIRQRRNVRTLTMLYSILNSSTAPKYLTPYFKYLCSTHDRNLRSTHNLLLSCPPHRSSLVHSSFNIQSILLWNALPLEIRMSTNRDIFKAKVRKLYIDLSAEPQ